uniref:GOLD domain-containing protein n=1 Tax=Sciurus vulgaris TaxID=55149 RepID=A0A8D2DZS9_SCIVU
MEDRRHRRRCRAIHKRTHAGTWRDAGVGGMGLPPMGLQALLLLVMCAAGAQGLYFHMGETEKRCFIEEIPDENMVIRNYQTQMWDKQKEVFLPSTPGLGMHVEVKDPDGKVVLFQQYGSEGPFTFTSHTPGEHQICLHSNSTRMALFAGGKLHVTLRLTSESTNQRVLWWSMAQTVAMVLTGIWQMRHLKSFFEAKKLV